MEQSNSLLLNEEALRLCPDPTKPVFVYEWLRYLHRILPHTRKADLKSCQHKLVEQLTSRIATGPGAPTRRLLGSCIAQVFAIADTYDLFATVNACNDALRLKEDGGGQLQVKLAALAVLGAMYERLGRMVGRSYEESFQLMARWLKLADWGSRVEILHTLRKMVAGLGPASNSIHKELCKLLTKSQCLSDRVLAVRAASAKCLATLVRIPTSPVHTLHELESIATLCVRAIDAGSDYELRMAVADVFAGLALHLDEAVPSTLMTMKKAPSEAVGVSQAGSSPQGLAAGSQPTGVSSAQPPASRKTVKGE